MKPVRRGIAAGLVFALVMCGLAACSSRASEWTDDEYVIAGGGSTGVYFDYGTHLAEELSGSLGIHMVTEETAGSVDNLLRVGSGDALIGFAQGDAAADAVAGAGAFAEPLPVQAVARLYDEYVHVVVRGESEIDDISDLAGRAVSLGAENSGVNVIAGRVLDAAGVDVASVRNPQFDLSASILAMESGEIDGFFWVGGLPTPGIAALAERMPVRLLPIEQDWVIEVNDRYSHAYRPADVPAGMYGLEAPTPTMAVPNYLITAESTPPAVVRDILAGLFDARSRIAQDVPAAALLDRRQAIFTGPVALHPGAVEFYRGLRG
ncbi:TAXI family TRAP transporter solute-binding subunit [Microbacterium sp. W4I20]|uniref:TAXI family TRAP transporter solute-binding subunit n=1 Tax=Microbacterium sp. W4I20 TaxID=3042262 RepID=UPI0027834B55|nr:TAXI family TRAP transporter solute-binding subunit [Microbacterium sp. W4I20]MDQ0729039.1 TRAP transporter TAXI family solute receptor [Microbacterium sp. W4I20]